MAYCGAQTSRGRSCRNQAGSCPHHNSWALAAEAPPSSPLTTSTPTRPAASRSRGSFVWGRSRRPMPGSRPGAQVGGSSPWRPIGLNGAAAVLLLVFVGVVLNLVAAGSNEMIVVAAMSVMVPVGLALGHWSTCGAWNLTCTGRCRNVRRGPFNRCQHHRGFALDDCLGLLWFATGVFALFLFAIPALNKFVQSA